MILGDTVILDGTLMLGTVLLIGTLMLVFTENACFIGMGIVRRIGESEGRTGLRLFRIRVGSFGGLFKTVTDFAPKSFVS